MAISRPYHQTNAISHLAHRNGELALQRLADTKLAHSRTRDGELQSSNGVGMRQYDIVAIPTQRILLTGRCSIIIIRYLCRSCFLVSQHIINTAHNVADIDLVVVIGISCGEVEHLTVNLIVVQGVVDNTLQVGHIDGLVGIHITVLPVKAYNE